MSSEPSMPLADFIEREKADDNLFWRLSSGDHQNLLDEAIEHIEQLEAELGRLRYFVQTIDEHAEAISTEVAIALHPQIVVDVVKDGSIGYAAGTWPGRPAEAGQGRCAVSLVDRLLEDAVWLERHLGYLSAPTVRRLREAADAIRDLQAELDRFYPADDAVELFSPEHEKHNRGELTVWFRDEAPDA